MVAADSLPGVAIVPNTLAQNPGAGHDVCARIVEMIPGLAELICPEGVDLHQADIDRAVAVMVDGGRVKAAFCFGDCQEKVGGDGVPLPGLLKTEGMNREGEYGYQEYDEGLFHRRRPWLVCRL